jgi:hypothetical protein
VKIYVAAVEAIRKKERHGQTQKTIKIDGLTPTSNANVHFSRLFFQSHPLYDQTQGTGGVFS